MKTDGQMEGGAERSHAPLPPDSTNASVFQIPDHQLLRRIAKGSYGEVWLARNMMGTYRAVKIVYRQAFDHDRPFVRELTGIEKFEPISRLHSGFVDVLQVGRNGQEHFFYYVMELGDDQSSGQQINPDGYCPKTLECRTTPRRRLPVRECVEIGITLADALHYLHENGLSHRDIKPSNIIFINGIPKLADIGLVTDIGPAHSYVGTEGFIAPEGPGTAQGDIFGLGKVLYEIGTAMDRHEFPALPADFDTYPDAADFREFNEIILRACHHDVKQRYASALEMQAELRVLQQGKSVKRLRMLELRWAIIKKSGVALGLLLAFLLIVAYPVYREMQVTRSMRERQIGVHVTEGIHAMAQGNILGAFDSHVKALELIPGANRPNENQRVRCSTALALCPKLTFLGYHNAEINWVEFSPDGQRILITKWNDKAQIWDLAQQKVVGPSFKYIEGLEMATFSPDGNFVAMAHNSKSASLWSAASGQEIHRWPHASVVFCARFSPDGKRVATGCKDAKARLWDAASGKLLQELGGHEDAVISTCFSKNGRWILTTSRDKTARLWNADTGEPTGPPLKHSNWVYYGCFSPDSQQVITACFDRKARIWEVPSGRFLPPAFNHDEGVVSAEYSPDGRLIATASLDGTVRIWEAATQRPYAHGSVLKHSSRLLCAGFSSDGHRLLTACADGTTWIWDLAANAFDSLATPDVFSPDGWYVLARTNQSLQTWDRVRNQPISSLMPTGSGLKKTIHSQNAQWLLTAATNHSGGMELRVWNAPTGKPASPPILAVPEPEGMALSQDGLRLALQSEDRAQTWAADTGKPLSPLLNFGGKITRVQFSPQGRHLMVVSSNKLHVCDSVTGREVFAPMPHPASISHADYSPDGLTLLTCFADHRFTECSAQLWNAQTGQPVGKPMKHRDGVLFAAFSPDGKQVVTASEDFTARVWDATSGRPLTPPLRHEDQVQSAAFSPDSQWILTVSSDMTACVWDVQTGEPITPFLRHPSPLWHSRFFRDSRHFLTAMNSQRAWLWVLPLDARPIEDLSSLAGLLSGRVAGRDTPEGPAAMPPGEVLCAAWKRLKTKYPGDFVTSKEETAHWHRQQAGFSEMNRQWKAALFHLDRLLESEPNQEELAKRRAAVLRNLDQNN